MKMLCSVALLFSASVEASSFTAWALVGIGQEIVLQYESAGGPIGEGEAGADVSALVDHVPSGYDFAWATVGATRTSFDGFVATDSTRDTWENVGTFAEADIYWRSAPLLVSSSYSGRGFIDLDAHCESGPDFGLCESSAGQYGTTLMEIEFNAPTRIWFHLNARSTGDERGVTSRADAIFTGALLGAFDENMNPVDFSYQYLEQTPEPSAGLLVLSGIAGLLLLRRRLHF